MPARVAVIGAGHHGLVAAIRLAEAGCDVTVLEAAPIPGGGVSSAELTGPGFVHDVHAAFFPMTHASDAFRDLELDLEWVNPERVMVYATDEAGGEVVLHRSLEATVASLEHCAPGAGRAWAALIQTLWPHREALIGSALARLPPTGSALRLLGGLRARALDLAPLALASSAAVGAQLFGEDRATAWLASSGAHADLLPGAAGSGVFSLGLNFLGHVVGWPFPRGGAGRLTEALVDRLRTHGGELRCGDAVARIEVSRNRIAAIAMQSGARLPVDGAICTLSPRPLLELLPSGALPGKVERRLSGWRYGFGTLKLDWALSGAVPWSSPSARESGVLHLGGPLSEIATSLNQASLEQFPDHPALVVGQQSVHDRTRAPAGKHTLYAYARVPQRPRLGEPEMAEIVERQIERFAPGFRSLIEARSVRPPSRVAEENPSMGDGDLASGSCAPDQQLFFRPALALCRGRTPIRGLNVAGAWVHPGPGVHGVSGRFAADALLRELRWKHR